MIGTVINYIGYMRIFGIRNIGSLVKKEYYRIIKETNFRQFKDISKEELRYIRAIKLSTNYNVAKFNIKLVAILIKVARRIGRLRK